MGIRVFGIGVFVVMALVLGPIAEGKFFPVVKHTHFISNQVFPDKNYMVFTYSGDKVRNCPVVSLNVLVKKNGDFIKGTVRYGAPAGTDAGIHTVPTSSPLGVQDFSVIISPISNEIILETYHNCHELWLTNTPLIHWVEKP